MVVAAMLHFQTAIIHNGEQSLGKFIPGAWAVEILCYVHASNIMIPGPEVTDHAYEIRSMRSGRKGIWENIVPASHESALAAARAIDGPMILITIHSSLMVNQFPWYQRV